MILGWRLFGDFDFKVVALGSGWCAVGASLVFGSVGAGSCRCLLENGLDSDGSWCSGLAEEGDNIEGFVLGED